MAVPVVKSISRGRRLRLAGLGLVLGSAVVAVVIVGMPRESGQDRDPRSAIEPAVNDSTAQVNAKQAISFNRDIRPILSDRCFACHGPDAAISKDAGGFRLDSFETATAEATSGKRPIIPGDPDGSELIKRITTTKASLQMPPASAKMTVTPSEVDLLRQWIKEGAKYEGHWAYATPIKPDLPTIANDDWARGAIDYFIASRLEQAGLSPSAEADRSVLIRRLSLDLIGLPPTPEEIDAFLNDTSPDAYEKLVDRLLSSPHFGERLALVWLDAARYADTIGYQLDHYRNAWPWRQWVIEAFNDNKPYDQFIIEQLAGDLLPDATAEQRLATAFCRMHMMNHEGGSIDEEFLVEAVGDRIETIATVFMAQTYTCAKCHDHKYDPTTQDDYYALYAYFNSIDERGVYTNKPEHALAYGPRMDWYTPAQRTQLAVAQAKLKAAEQARLDAAPDIAAEQAVYEKERRERYDVRWAKAELVKAYTSDLAGEITIKPDGSALLSSRDIPHKENFTLVLKTQAKGLRLLKIDALPDAWTNGRLGRSYDGNAIVTGLKVRAISIRDPEQSQDVVFDWAWASKSQQGNDFDVLNLLTPGNPGWSVAGQTDQHPRTLLLVAKEPFGFEGGATLHITLEHQSRSSRQTLGRVRAHVATAKPDVREAFPVVQRDWYQAGPFPAEGFDQAFDTAFGPESFKASMGKREAGGKQQWVPQPKIIADKAHPLGGKNRAYYLGRTILTPVKRQLNLTLSGSAARVWLNGKEVATHRKADKRSLSITLEPGENKLIIKAVNANKAGSFRVQAEGVGQAPIALAPLALVEPGLRNAHDGGTFSEMWRTRQSASYTALSASVNEAGRTITTLTQQATPVTVMAELDKPRPMFLLERGEYNKRIQDRPAVRQLPSWSDLPMPQGSANDRLGFAKWLVQPDHPLTARVHVNRIWQMLFGTGIVATVEDFGSQADWPSHLELLDFLAVDFVASGWDQKALIKQIVMSATYRQRAKRQTGSLEIDPNNRLLSSFPRYRLEAELIRDQALAASGLLNETIGGPSVKPYQPAGLWREVAMSRSNTAVFKRDDGEALYRRSMYTFIKRKAPPPQMSAFGAPNREACVVRRDVTNTPMQALVLWNDEQFLEAARVLAQRTLAEAKTDDDRLAILYRRCTGEVPDERERAILQEALAYYKSRYAEAPQDAADLLDQGEYPLPQAYDPAELASWMMVASAVLTLDQTIVRD